jgi:SnoaL-like polyketide cyclase
MKKIILFFILITSLSGVNTVFAGENIAQLKQKISELQAQVDAHKKERVQTAQHLEIFDELDLEAFNNRDMKRIGEIHADNVIVHNPDGTQTSPFPPHEEELRFLFDTFNFKVTDHIVGFGYGEWTAGISISEGKWVKPITLPDGTVLQPTGKKVRLKIATIARWKNDRIVEEYLFWDNKDWNKQIGMK